MPGRVRSPPNRHGAGQLTDMPLALLIGIGAGLASAVLFLSASRGTPDVVLLFVLSPLPVALAGLGWGWLSAAVAAVVAATAAGMVGTGRTALVHAVALGVPMVTFCYFLMLNRPVAAADGSNEVALEWYPVGRMIAWASLGAGIISALALFGTASDAEGLRRTFLEVLDRVNVLRGADGRDLTAEQKQAFARTFVYIFPWAIASMWFVIAIANIWVAGHVTRLSGRLARPWPDLSAITLPAWMALAFAASVALSFLPDMTGLVASGFASGIMFAFMLLGLAVLHGMTRGSAMRPMMLTMIYLSLLFFSPISSLAVALVGLAEPMLRNRRPPPQNT